MKDNVALVGKWVGIGLTAAAAAWMGLPNLVQTLIIIMGLDVLSGAFAT